MSLFRCGVTVALFKGFHQLSHGQQGTEYQQKQNGALNCDAMLSVASDQPHDVRHHGQPPFLQCQLAENVWHKSMKKVG